VQYDMRGMPQRFLQRQRTKAHTMPIEHVLALFRHTCTDLPVALWRSPRNVCPSLKTNKKALLDELIDAGAMVATIEDKSPAELAKELAGMCIGLASVLANAALVTAGSPHTSFVCPMRYAVERRAC